MNRFIYYYRVFDIVVNQTTGELYWRSLHCLAYLKMGIVEGENEENKGNESSTMRHLVEPVDYATNFHCKGTAGGYKFSRQKLADCRYIGGE